MYCVGVADVEPTEIDPELLKNPLFKELMAEGLATQGRFSAEPVYAKTGKGYLKSAGVDELKKVKESLRLKEKADEEAPED